MKKSLKKAISVLKLGHLWSGIASFFLLFLGISGAVFAGLGTCLFCLVPILTFFLSIFGLSIGIISDYNYVFIGFGILSMFTTFILYKKRKKFCKTCKVKK